MPLQWFMKPFYSKLRSHMKPPTTRTCRRVVTVRLPMPRACFDKFMEPYADDSDIGVERDDQGALKPTTANKSTNYYRSRAACTRASRNAMRTDAPPRGKVWISRGS